MEGIIWNSGDQRGAVVSFILHGVGLRRPFLYVSKLYRLNSEYH